MHLDTEASISHRVMHADVKPAMSLGHDLSKRQCSLRKNKGGSKAELLAPVEVAKRKE